VSNYKCSAFNDVYSFYIVQSERENEVIENRIKLFLKELQEYINQMDDDEFEMHKESVISGYEETFKNLGEFFCFYKEIYYAEAFDMEYKKKVIEKVNNMKKSEIRLSSACTTIIASKKIE